MFNDFLLELFSAFGARKWLGPNKVWETKYFRVHAPRRPKCAVRQKKHKNTARIDRAMVEAFKLCSNSNLWSPLPDDKQFNRPRYNYLINYKIDVYWATPDQILKAANKRGSKYIVQGLTISTDMSVSIWITSFKPFAFFLANELLGVACWIWRLSGKWGTIPKWFIVDKGLQRFDDWYTWANYIEDWQRSQEGLVAQVLRDGKAYSDTLSLDLMRI